jgi:hypothetical protein
MRAKLQDGELIYPPSVSARPDGSTVIGYGMREDLLIADGWKVVVEVAKPSSGLWVGSWLESTDAITRVWTPREKTAAEQEADAQAVAQRAANDASTAAHAANVQALRDDYAAATAQVCQLCGITPVVRCLTRQQALQVIVAAPEAAKTTLALLATHLTNLEGKLCREDGKDALNRV